ncbi:LytR/AlgR family response regulator transcription factor [Aureibacter tunicatorum]|uniref:DNA-binding LytR/AlgR family response regulator n=1 Tax=Aureibacter tunicatorum TaxID=866807 RepID=A0AAE3XTC9_9BACT|nr:LytTR family DNA-binding domain-containing protein [Aureibacter tunicatorum]MDR6241294.1 DNA-binding LytR/AlgR family response regulator [Aureibacter tunicatorum]BDD03554.1 DNA-binding response regulator [Aureibacter tunicatorum]
MEKIRTIVVEDERMVRQLLIEYISKIPQLELVGEFNNPLEALNFLSTDTPDLMFLDIQMPDITGIELLESLPQKPLTVFTTAYSEHALKGYELGVFDYLLKPIVFTRFLQTINKVIKYYQEAKDVASMPHEESSDTGYKYVSTYTEYISVKANHHYYKINYSDLVYLESQREYVIFHTHDDEISCISSLKKLEMELPEEQFIRVHKSFIVSIKQIKSLYGNELTVGQSKIPVGLSYRNKVLEIFEKK